METCAKVRLKEDIVDGPADTATERIKAHYPLDRWQILAACDEPSPTATTAWVVPSGKKRARE